jgi:hypothetical protein
MPSLIRSEHFKSFVESKYVEAFAIKMGWEANRAKDHFKDSFYDDYTMLTWILDNTFPHTYRDGNNYKFVTNPISHSILLERGDADHSGVKPSKGEIEIGKLTFWLDGLREMFAFENKDFRHGHVGGGDDGGSITCYGGYNDFATAICKTGFSGALMSAYNFATVSRYGSTLKGELSDKW